MIRKVNLVKKRKIVKRNWDELKQKFMLGAYKSVAEFRRLENIPENKTFYRRTKGWAKEKKEFEAKKMESLKVADNEEMNSNIIANYYETLRAVNLEIIKRLNEDPGSFTGRQLIKLSRDLSDKLEGKLLEVQSSGGWLKLRYEILMRDEFTCKYCGRTPLKHGVELHVDHIIPRSQGGTNAKDNLITACNECNLGKRDVLLMQRAEEKVKQAMFD
jgi:5-methylcytosine-specific restriction endonuclease McrA